MRLLASGRLVCPDRVAEGWLRIADGRLIDVDTGPAPSSEPDEHTVQLDGYVLPGFVDVHCHGGGGAAFTSGVEAQARAAAEFHLGHGSTTLLASLVTAPLDTLATQAATLTALAADGTVAGLHFEGPFLAAKRCGAQNPAHLRDPDPAAVETLLDAAAGYAAMITVAPELPGALDLVRRAQDAGVITAIGHTDASYEQAQAAIDAGATVATHLFNGMRPLHHREPGPILACLAAPQVTCELINDGVHLDPHVVRFAAQNGTACLVTDAISAAGSGDGSYQLGALAVQVTDGVARLAEGGTIAGSTLTMDAAVRRAVRDCGLSLVDASSAASFTPARALGLADTVGTLEPGKRADLVVLDDDLELTAVMRAGEWVVGP